MSLFEFVESLLIFVVEDSFACIDFFKEADLLVLRVVLVELAKGLERKWLLITLKNWV